MVFDHIEKLKREYTSKYVAVDTSRPELARFAGCTGQVKTINMNGRALVEFLDHNVNIGRYDIDVDYLKVVEKPEIKTPEPKKKKSAAKKTAPAAKAPTADKASGVKKMSLAEKMAAKKAAKTTESAEKTAPAVEGGKKMTLAEKLAAKKAAK